MQELIAVRVKDGIFVGNVIASQDRDFIEMNKITHIINCAGGELPDLFVHDGVKYLTFPWRDTTGSICTAVMFDSADENIERTVHFIDEAIESGYCVLVHSHFGVSRSPALIAAYFIVKYGWKLDNALAFLEMAHKDMCIRPHFLRQLRMFAKRNCVDHDVFDPDVDDSQFGLDNDQWMLRNTLLNGLTFEMQGRNSLYKFCTSKVEFGTSMKPSDAGIKAKGRKGKRIVFIDTKQGTHVDSEDGAPVVNVQSLQQLDSSNHFLGFHGSVSLRSWHSRSGIMSRSISPCTRRVESDPRTNPRGRQELTVRSESKMGRSASGLDGPSLSLTARTATGCSTLEGGAHAGAETRHIALPSTIHPPGRSPFATLTSSHKYRKGSPLPAPTHDAKPTRPAQRPSSATVADNNFSRLRVASNLGAPRVARTSLMRTGSPTSLGGSVSSVASAPSARASSYKNIAPHRSQPSRGVVSAWDANKTGEPPSVVQRSSLRNGPQGSRRGSPVGRPNYASVRVASSSGVALESHANRNVNGGSNATKIGGSVIVRRHSPVVASSVRRL
ncbi:putative dual specificity protein phosphatase [Trypanosoma rangeli]|uniref:Putative dual specificity protein phosphatase n=1 Tax=Trypanosoma rangeli TaxID=5698 RepID=A0A3R7MFE4_TRYRA|nr:putative dual specificity protein phosphatase [Trypanosoma rangeli]RNF04836.1 putative dual specificity protein phosphatase [Trypanosoma rangeli]|eukprot:RNF04836.1 putative dual specificity protein phosphatase [Trypanosoma rangeli]